MQLDSFGHDGVQCLSYELLEWNSAAQRFAAGAAQEVDWHVSPDEFGSLRHMRSQFLLALARLAPIKAKPEELFFRVLPVWAVRSPFAQAPERWALPAVSTTAAAGLCCER